MAKTSPAPARAPRKQTRKSVSIKGPSYRRVSDYCDAQKISMSSFFEELIILKLGPSPEGQKVDLEEEDEHDEDHAQEPDIVPAVEPIPIAAPLSVGPVATSEPIAVVETASEAEAEEEIDETRDLRDPFGAAHKPPQRLKPEPVPQQQEAKPSDALENYVPPILMFG